MRSARLAASTRLRRDGLLPAPLARLHPRFRTPWVAIIVHAVIAWALASIGSFGVLVLLANVALLFSYLLCCLAAIELQRRNVQTDGTPVRAPWWTARAGAGLRRRAVAALTRDRAGVRGDGRRRAPGRAPLRVAEPADASAGSRGRMKGAAPEWRRQADYKRVTL